MKKIIFATLAMITFISCEKKESIDGTNLHITGNIEGLSQGKLYIQKIQDSTLVVLDSIQIKGLYPCGEGAGFAGGIISAAIDGEKCALKIAESLGENF
jgi:hypothetical protein